jgi:hypothetical protein
MLAVIPHVDVPETETLSFGNNIDAYRQFCGPANLASKPVISIELGADFAQAYHQTWTDLLMDAKRAFAGGVNHVIIHGATYSHNFTNTTWPGYTTFSYLFAGQHSRNQPAWDVYYKQPMDYLARNQFILQEGVPKVDLAFWNKQTAQNAYPTTLYEPSDLRDTGYTYDYLSPENFRSLKPVVERDFLANEQQAYQALVLRANDTLTTDGVEKLAEYARAGLPIIFTGGVPSTWASGNKSAVENSKKTLENLLNLKNVHQVPFDGLATTVARLGIVPRSTIQANGTWYTRWRQTADGDIYAFIYNDGQLSTGNITFSCSGRPSLLDSWTGEESPIVHYSVHAGRITIPLTLRITETKIIKFSGQHSAERSNHVVATSNSVLGFTTDNKHQHAWAKVATSQSSFATLASGQTLNLSSTAPAAITLGDWLLTVEKWIAPSDLYNSEVIADKQNATYHLTGRSLVSWNDIAPQNVSGIGYYHSNFSWSGEASFGAVLSLPPVAHGLMVSLNGHELPALDCTNPTMDITTYLSQGTNSIVLKVPTTLWNALIPVWDDLVTAGIGPILNVSTLQAFGYDAQTNGIIGDVLITPYQLVQIF